METQVERKPPLPSSQPSIFIIKKTSYNHVLAQTYTSTQAPTCRRIQPFLVTSLSWKGATTPCSRLPATTGGELQPPYWRLDPQYHCRPHFINFQTGSKIFNTTLHLSTNILRPVLQTKQWSHCNQNIRDNPDFRIDMQKHIQPWAIISSDTICTFI